MTGVMPPLVDFIISVMDINNGICIQYGQAAGNSTIYLPLALQVIQVVGNSQDTGDGNIVVCSFSDYLVGSFFIRAGYNGSIYNDVIHFIAITF